MIAQAWEIYQRHRARAAWTSWAFMVEHARQEVQILIDMVAVAGIGLYLKLIGDDV